MFNQYEDVPLTKEVYTDWMEQDTTFSLEALFEVSIDLFNEKEIDNDKLKALICSIKKNKLYDLFKRDTLNKPLVKRRRSPGEETTMKLRRMSITSGSSPSLRRSRRVTPDPGKDQPLITQAFGRVHKTVECKPKTIFNGGSK